MMRRALLVLALVVALPLTGCVMLPSLWSGGSQESPQLPAEQPGADAASFGEQQPEWRGCGDGFECAKVYAPLDWEDPAGERITLNLVKHPATGGDPLGTLFVNPGGPGASGADYVKNSLDYAVQPAVQQRYDVIGWDPRGVGASSAVTCLDAGGLDEYLFGAGSADGLEQGSDEWIAANFADAEAFGKACAESTGALLAHVDTASTVQDLDMLRAVVGDAKLNYLGYSYGTYIGALYADAYPERVGRLVLDGAMDPSASEADVVREQTLGFENALRAYVTDCLTRESCPLDGPVDNAMAQIGDLLDRVDENPIEGSDGRTLYTGTMLTAIVTPLYSQDSWGYLDKLFETVAVGDADTAFLLADFYYNRENGEYLDNSTEAFMAINCLDYPNDLDNERMREAAAELAGIAPTIGRFQGYGDIGCAAWPHKAAQGRGAVSAEGADPILVVGTTGDPATPYKWAESLANQLDSGVLVTYVGEGHTAYGDNECVNRTVHDYLLRGTVPKRDPRCSSA